MLQSIVVGAHYVKHFRYVLIAFLLLFSAMLFKLAHKLSLVVLVDVGDLLDGLGVIVFVLNATKRDLVGISEPDGLVVVLEELTLHAQYLYLVQLLNVEGHLVALLKAVFELVVLN